MFLFQGEGETRPLFLSASLASTNRSSPSVYNIYIFLSLSLTRSTLLFLARSRTVTHTFSPSLSLSRTRYRLSGNTRKVYNICISRYMVESRFAKIVSAFSRRGGGGGRSVSPTFSLHFFFQTAVRQTSREAILPGRLSFPCRSSACKN